MILDNLMGNKEKFLQLVLADDSKTIEKVRGRINKRKLLRESENDTTLLTEDERDLLLREVDKADEKINLK